MKTAIALGVIGGLALGVAHHSNCALHGARAARRARQHPRPRGPPPPPPAPPNPAATVVAPFYGNEKCPIDGRATLRDKSVEAEGQRIYACSDVCVEAIKIDSANMLKKA